MSIPAGAATIRCDRFALVPFTLEFIDALLARDIDAAERALGVKLPGAGWIATDERFLNFRRADLIRAPSSAPWLARAIVRPDRAMAGHIGFHDPPNDDGIVELGYTVFEPHRRRGYAFEAISSMMAWAMQLGGVRRFRLAITPDNAPSLALAAKLGFAPNGQQIDEFDGLELIFEREAT